MMNQSKLIKLKVDAIRKQIQFKFIINNSFKKTKHKNKVVIKFIKPLPIIKDSEIKKTTMA